MSFRLVNENDPRRALSMNSQTWHNILNLAEEYGWNPMGAIPPAEWYEQAGYHLASPERGSYAPYDHSLILFEDALNLADALERAFLDYEPEHVPAWSELALRTEFDPADETSPALGAVMLTIDFCQLGAFTVEKM